jgi:hypothetical protein
MAKNFEKLIFGGRIIFRIVIVILMYHRHEPIDIIYFLIHEPYRQNDGTMNAQPVYELNYGLDDRGIRL